jgi:hypothetical protein
MRYVIWLFLALAIAPSAQAVTLTRNPTDDAEAGFFLNPTPMLGVLFDGNAAITPERNDGANNHSLGLLEFDVSELDGGDTVLVASITIYVNLFTSVEPGPPTRARAGVYNGVDGSVTVGDFSPATTAALAGIQDVDLGLLTIPLNTAQVQALISGGTNFLGVSLFVEPNNQTYHFAALEDSIFPPAVLEIIYVPEPSSIVLMLVAVAGLAYFKRRLA